MEDPINVGKGLICGLLFLAALAWQLYIYTLCSGSSRTGDRAIILTFGIPGGLAIITVILTAIGTIGYGVLAGIDPQRNVEFWPLAKFFIAVTAVAVSFFLKNCVNAVLLGATLSWTTYSFLFHGNFSFIPIYRLLFEFASASAPDWLQYIYTILSLGYALVSAIASSLDHDFNIPFIDN